MGAQSVTGTGPGECQKRIAYITPNNPQQLLVNTTNPQDIIGSGISPADVGGGGDTVPPLANLYYVAKNGDDSTGDGSIGKPYLTIQKGIDEANAVATVLQTIRPCVYIMPGTYTENLVLGANIMLRGLGYNNTRIAGNIVLDSTWSAAGDWRGGFADIGIFGTFTADFAAVSSNEGKIYATNVRFGGNVTFTAQSTVNQFLMYGGEYFGTMTINGMNVVLSGVMSQGASLVFNATNAGLNAWQTSGNVGNVTVNNTTLVAHPVIANFGHSVQPGASLTINGQIPNINATVNSIPLASLINLTSGATLAQLTNINDANLTTLIGNTLGAIADTVINGTEEVVYVSTVSNPVSLTLPDPIFYRSIKIKDIGGNLAVNNLTLVRFGSETIDGVAANAVFSTNYQAISIRSDGLNWWLV